MPPGKRVSDPRCSSLIREPRHGLRSNRRYSSFSGNRSQPFARHAGDHSHLQKKLHFPGKVSRRIPCLPVGGTVSLLLTASFEPKLNQKPDPNTASSRPRQRPSEAPSPRFSCSRQPANSAMTGQDTMTKAANLIQIPQQTGPGSAANRPSRLALRSAELLAPRTRTTGSTDRKISNDGDRATKHTLIRKERDI